MNPLSSLSVLHYILSAIGMYISIYVVYHLLLLGANLFSNDDESRRAYKPKNRFIVIIPAHNEELLIRRNLSSFQGQAYPPELVTVVVVADNCTDDTAKIARGAGARVLERNDPGNRGKGHAIRFAFLNIAPNEYDALVIIDADSFVAGGFLMELDRLFQQGEKIIQCYNGVANPDENWFTRLLDVSRTLGNVIYHPAKQKLGLSSYLMGNGMCFSRTVIEKYGWDAFSVGEDWEYYAKLMLQGETIGFAGEARVYHQESSSLKQATSQRMRWSSGRFAVIGRYGITLFLNGIREGNITKVDAALPLLLPNPSLAMNITLAGFGLALIPCLITGACPFFPAWFSLLAGTQLFLFLMGIVHTQNRMKKVLSLFAAPLFLCWKTGIDILSLVGIGRKNWIRTNRKL